MKVECTYEEFVTTFNVLRDTGILLRMSIAVDSRPTIEKLATRTVDRDDYVELIPENEYTARAFKEVKEQAKRRPGRPRGSRNKPKK